MSVDHSLPPSRRRSLHAPGLVRGAFFCGLVLVCMGSLADCGRIQHATQDGEDGFAVVMTTEPATAAVGQSLVVVTLRDPAGAPVESARLNIEANMSHAGMVPVMGRVDGGPGGVYRVPMTWTMAGDWYLDVKFSLADGQIVTRRFPVSVQ